ncbi:hypothetical protein AB1A81_11575 [Bdellovibrio bacteriovorus]|nr:hypothetical protein [Bdellovibrio bacteriovorus]AHZ85033.1 hypothetical protein EP01_08790 [Bdellovibrio bacteriovorus]BEV68921.1 hypothetical protein Bb109J_c2341 [Bdellovibrio bacteriovorus]
MKLGVLKTVAVGSAGLAMILGFQNCSDFALQDQVLYEQGIFDSREALDQKSLPKLLSSSELSFWSKPGNPSYVNKALFMADQLSFVVALDTSMTGKVFSVSAGANQEDAYINIAAGKIRVVRAAPDASNISFMEVNLPSTGSKMVIAAGFGVKPTEMSLQVNGVVQTAEIQKTGTPGDFAFTVKSVATGGTGGQIYEYVVYGGSATDGLALTKGELNVMSRYVATNNLIENVIFDPALINEGKEVVEENPKFLAAKAVIDAKCLSCHNSSSYGDFRNLTETKALSRGLVKAKDLAGSKLYYRLTGATVGPGPRNMPTSGSMSSAEAQAVADWIDSIE